VGVGRKQDPVDVEVKEVLFIRSNSGRQRSRDNRRPQVISRLDAFRTASNKELVIDVFRTERMKSKAWIASKVGPLR
jgi:hypothetical protein